MKKSQNLIFITTLFIIFMIVGVASSFVDNEPIYWDVVQKIIKEGFKNSRIMKDVSYLTDVFGPRLAKSPSYLAAVKWATKRFEEYGLKNVHLEPYKFGVGWNLAQKEAFLK